jgi:hypothetical protein
MSDNRIQQGDEGVEDIPASQETDEDILQEARDRYQSCVTDNADNDSMAREDLLFLSGGSNQWEPEAARIRTAERRPMMTVNNLPTFLHQVTNEQRMNTPGINVHPVDDHADKETAEVLTGLIRHIQYDSNADVCYDTAVNSAAAIGIGWFRLATEFESNDSMDHKIMFKRIRNPLSVKKDPLSTDIDGSDMNYCFVDSVEDRAEFKRKYPDAEANNTNLVAQEQYRGWFTDKTVLLTNYYRIKKTKATLCKLTDGSVGWKDDLPKVMHVEIIQERESEKREVECFLMTGTDILSRTPIKCKWIPVFPVYGDEIDIDGKVIRSGIIRNAKDAFKMYNLFMTLAVEELTLRPKTPFIGAVGQFETAKQQWASANNRSYAYIEYDPVTADGNIAPPPQRQPMADVPTGMLAMMMHAADNKKATMGLFDASLGNKGTATSGIQEREQQQQGDVANFHYADNLNKTVVHVGRCIVDMIPHYYDMPRTLRILGEDEISQAVPVNQEYEKKEKGSVKIALHDLTVGQYDVTVSAGPSFSSKRQEAAEFMTNALQAAKDPATSSVLTYLAIKNQDIAGAEEATKMLKKLLPPNIAEPDEDEEEPMMQTPKGPMPVSQVPKLIEQMGMALQNAEQALDKANADKIKLDQGDLMIKQAAEQTKHFEAETHRFDAEEKQRIEKERLEIEKMRAQTERIAAIKEALTVEKPTAEDGMEGETPQGASTEEIAMAIVNSLREPEPMPSTMTVTAPSGQTYQVQLH